MNSSAGPQRETEVLRMQIDTFYQVNRFISSIDNLEGLQNLIMREAEAAVEAEASCIALYDPEDNRLHIKFVSGEGSDSVRHLSQAIEQGILGAAAATNTFVLVEDAQNDPRWDPSADRKTGFTTRSILATPIRRRDELLGVLEVINKRGDPRFTETEANCWKLSPTRRPSPSITLVWSSGWSSRSSYQSFSGWPLPSSTT